MKIKFFKVNPGGNITAIVKGSFSKEERITISKAILKSFSEIEQVGFWDNPKKGKATARIEMMGGEFCGNGARSLAFVVWREKNLSDTFFIESSGINKELQVSISSNLSTIKIPISSFSIQTTANNNPIVILPGICHLITKNKVNNKEEAKKILEENNLLKEDASGVVAVINKEEKIMINPFVWVRDTRTLYEETACASGTLALAYLKYKNKEGKTFKIEQPSGTDFIINIDSKNISLSGPIKKITTEEVIV